jgi:hypothetical protein
MADTYDLEEYWEAIRPGWNPEKPKVTTQWSTLPNPLKPNNLEVFSYQGCSSTIPTFIIWNGIM